MYTKSHINLMYSVAAIPFKAANFAATWWRYPRQPFQWHRYIRSLHTQYPVQSQSCQALHDELVTNCRCQNMTLKFIKTPFRHLTTYQKSGHNLASTTCWDHVYQNWHTSDVRFRRSVLNSIVWHITQKSKYLTSCWAWPWHCIDLFCLT